MRIRGGFFNQSIGLGQAKDIDSKIAEAERNRDGAKIKFQQAEAELKYWAERYGKDPKNAHYKRQFEQYKNLVETFGDELGRLIKLVKDLKRIKYEAPRPTGLKPIPFDWSTRATRTPGDRRQATIYPSRIPTLPFGGSFWGGGLT